MVTITLLSDPAGSDTSTEWLKQRHIDILYSYYVISVSLQTKHCMTSQLKTLMNA